MPKSKEPCRDATKRLTLDITPDEIKNGKRYGSCSKKDPGPCMLELNIHHNYPGSKFRVWKNIVKIWFPKDNFWTRYQSTSNVRQMIALFDRGTLQTLQKANLLKVPDTGLRLVLVPPRPSQRLEHFHGEIHKARKAAYVEKRKIMDKKGIKPKKYTREKVITINPDRPSSITLESIRSGQGYTVKL